MALQVWLPLNKDLRNVGISNASPINHGGAINNSGMIGNCYEFAGTSGKYLDTGYGNGVNAKNISVCLWVKPLSSLNDKILLGVVGDSGINKRLYLGVKSNTYNIAYGSTTWGRTSNAAVTLNEWQHLCIVVKNRTATLYLNGNLTDETKTYNTDFDFQTNIFIGGRTDVRILIERIIEFALVLGFDLQIRHVCKIPIGREFAWILLAGCLFLFAFCDVFKDIYL